MKKPEFETFNDGTVDFYTVKGNRPDEKFLTLRYGEKIIGVTRFYAARAATTSIDMLIRVPQYRGITAAHNAVIAGVRYKIDQVQHIGDTYPPTTVLTLKRLGVMP